MPKQILSSSRIARFLECPKRHHFEYDLRFRPRPSEAISFGRLMHDWIEWFWTVESETDALVRSWRTPTDADPFAAAELSVLSRCYARAWGAWLASNASTRAKVVEKEFRCSLVRESTNGRMQRHRRFDLGGKIDLALEDADTGAITLVEHKTTTRDVSDGSSYWQKLAIDHQLAAYLVGLESLGLRASRIVYDVIRRAPKPIKATPVEKRKYTKAGELYASQRDHDETPDEYRERVEAWAADQREVVAVKTFSPPDRAMADFLEDAWAVASSVARASDKDEHPKNPSACHARGRCPFWECCAFGTPLEHLPNLDRNTPQHPELETLGESEEAA